MTPPDNLRRAASLLRERAEAATPGPWTSEATEDAFLGAGGVIGAQGEGVVLDAEMDDDATYIATMHPAVGTLLARWIDDVAAMCDEVWRLTESPTALPPGTHFAMAIADLILGGAQ